MVHTHWIGTGLFLLLTFGTLFVIFVTYTDILKLLGCEKEYNIKLSQKLNQADQKCYRDAFSDVLLVIVFNYDLYDSIPTLNRLYKKAFPSIAFCGRDTSIPHQFNISYEIVYGMFGYQCLSEAISKYPGFKGYLYINDDMIVNFWNFVNLDKSKIWQGALITNGAPMFSKMPLDSLVSNWVWINSSFGLKACVSAYKEMYRVIPKSKFQLFERNLLHNGNGILYCSKGWSDLFYIPGIHAKTFMHLADIFYDNQVFLEIAVTTIIRMLEPVENTVKLSGHYLPDLGASDSRAFWTTYTTDVKFVHPFKLHTEEFRDMNFAILNNWVMKHVDKITNCKD